MSIAFGSALILSGCSRSEGEGAPSASEFPSSSSEPMELLSYGDPPVEPPQIKAGAVSISPLAYQWRTGDKIDESQPEVFPENAVTIDADNLSFTIQSGVKPAALRVSFFSGFTDEGLPDESSQSEVECVESASDTGCSYTVRDETVEVKVDAVPHGTAVAVVSAQYMTSSERDLNDGYPSFTVSWTFKVNT